MTCTKKRQQFQARMANAARAVLSTNKVCIINLNAPTPLQTTFHHGNGKLILANDRITRALCDVPHRWTLYLAVFCDSGTQKYTKAIEVMPSGIYKAEHLTEVIEHHHTALVSEQNPKHVVSSGWIATPYQVEFSEDHADWLFDKALAVSMDYTNITKPGAFTL